jgi:type II secretory ATPase GspE/PulE/Tfp pilus assembly ATPase PilB-like protein
MPGSAQGLSREGRSTLNTEYSLIQKMQSLEERLLESGLLSRAQLDEALVVSRRAGESLAQVLLQQRLVPEKQLLPVVAEQYGLEFVELGEYPVEPRAVQAVTAKLAAHYGVMPILLDAGVLTLAVANPVDMAAVDDVQTNLGYHVDRVLSSPSDIRNALRRYYGVGADTVERILADSPGRGTEVEVAESHDLEKMAEDTSVVKLVNQLLQEAIRDRATDLHFEVDREGVTVRRRIDGVLYDTRVPHNIRLLYPAIVSRVKLMSGLDIVERRLPQDGRVRVTIGREMYDLRISVVPAIHGEDVVVRILPATMLFDLEQLGFSDGHVQVLKEFISKPHGIGVVTGPTGSGKSTTLYACLSRLNTRERKIITIEDPVEYELKGITQTQINPKIDLSFSRSLRSMLRHDPDVMMVGEMRDSETAEIAIQTAMTGHLVLSTLHTNDASSGAVRLIDMGIDPYLITSTVELFTAQRLVRVICADCREEVKEPQGSTFRGRGCKKCRNTGYRGRVAICEVLPMDPAIQEQILAKSSARDIRRTADGLGMTTLAQDGMEKVARGITTAEEILRVTSM